MCNYNKCQASLIFHHKNTKEKKLQFSNINERINSLEQLKENIAKELDECQLLCYNCHKQKHIDLIFFKKYKKKIYIKKINAKERKNIDSDKVMLMYNSGMKQIDICKELSLAKSTISDIIKRNK